MAASFRKASSMGCINDEWKACDTFKAWGGFHHCFLLHLFPSWFLKKCAKTSSSWWSRHGSVKCFALPWSSGGSQSEQQKQKSNRWKDSRLVARTGCLHNSIHHIQSTFHGSQSTQQQMDPTIPIQSLHPPKFNSSPLKNDAWKTRPFLLGYQIFSSYVKLCKGYPIPIQSPSFSSLTPPSSSGHSLLPLRPGLDRRSWRRWLSSRPHKGNFVVPNKVDIEW